MGRDFSDGQSNAESLQQGNPAVPSLKGWRRIGRTIFVLALLTHGVSAGMHVSGSLTISAPTTTDASPDFPGLDGARGLFEYRKFSSKLIELWRQYTAMADALSHVLRDYNVAVVQEKRKELTKFLIFKHREAEDLVDSVERQGRDASPLMYSEMASLKEIKRQIKVADLVLDKIPDDRFPERNSLIIEEGLTPVDVSAALSRGSAKLFYKSVSTYRRHLRKFKRICLKIYSLVQKFKADDGEVNRGGFAPRAADLGNLFDADGPVSLRMPLSK